MKIKMVSLLTVAALFLSLCACSGGEVETNRHEMSGEISAGLTTEADSSWTKTVNQPTSGTSTTSGEAETISSQTTTTKKTTTTTRALEVLKYGNTTWKEVPIKKEDGWIMFTDIVFNLRGAITTADYVFSGTVISRKEYEGFKTDEEGKVWGPSTHSIIEVKVDQTYYGQLPIKGDIIKIHYSHSFSRDFENSVVIRDQEDYVFITRSVSGYADYDPAVKQFTNAYISAPYYFDVFPIENGDVFAYERYFNWNQNLMKKAKPDRKTDRISSGETGDQYVVMDKKDFVDAFNQLFENPETLPTAKNIFALDKDKTTSSQTETISSQTTSTISASEVLKRGSGI